jgi:SAM-dependent methyltransferase
MSEPTQPTQKEYWNARAGEHWAAHADRYDEILRPYRDAIIDATETSPGQRVLDVGCGNGGLALAIAERVGPEGEVVGLDLSAPMLGAARSRAEAAGARNVTFIEGDAQRYALEAGSFDRVVSRFGVMFFDDPVAAFANLRRVLNDSGRLTFACWQELALNDWMLVPAGALVQHVGMPELGEPGGPGPFAFADPSHLRSVLEGAGWSDVGLEGLSCPQLLGRDVDDAYEFYTHQDVVLGLLADADAATKEVALAALRAALEERAGPDGVLLSGAIWLVTASP